MVWYLIYSSYNSIEIGGINRMSLFGKKKPLIHDRVYYSRPEKPEGDTAWKGPMLAIGSGLAAVVIARTLTYVACFVWNNFILALHMPYQEKHSRIIWHHMYHHLSGWMIILIIFAIGALAGYGLLRKITAPKRESNSVEHLLKQYKNDPHLALTEKLPERYDFVPDAGAHHSINASSILAHVMLTDHGVKDVEIPQRNKNGDLIEDDDGRIKYHRVPIIDQDFGEKLYESDLVDDVKMDSGNPARKWFNPTRLNYNHNLQIFEKKSRPYRKVSDLINHDWTLPDYELTRPAGGYIVDTANSNTIIAAETRAGKGQSIIQPMLDVWSRSTTQFNIVDNDPKGENATLFYYPFTKRGYQVVIFNLMDSERTNIYNPLGLAIQSSRKADFNFTNEQLEELGTVFFPPIKGAEPMWQNSAKAMFQQAAFALIDYYLEEEHEIQYRAIREGWSQNKLDITLDDLWKHVSLYNVYQMLIQLSSKKSSDWNIVAVGAQGEPPKENWDKEKKRGAVDYLSLFFNATAQLPVSSLRRSALDKHNILSAMAGSQQTLSSVYGIALSGLSFFADTTIINLTSGKPSDDFDLLGMGFPRRIELQLRPEYMREKSLINAKYRWRAYHDKYLTKMYKDAEYVQLLNKDGWLYYPIKPVFKERITYLTLELIDSKSNILIKKFVFKFKKDYKRTPNGEAYQIDSVTNERIIDGGLLIPVAQDEAGAYTIDASQGRAMMVAVTEYDIAAKTADLNMITGETFGPNRAKKRTRQELRPIINNLYVHYNERPKAVFVVAPPQKSMYAEIMMLLFDQMFNQQIDFAYKMMSDQKPFYGTNYLIDELGNLKANGTGIPDLITKESIGLSAMQRWFLIAQAWLQITEVYGKEAASIIESNTKTIGFIASIDKDLRNHVSAISGKMHVLQQTGDSNTVNVDNVVGKTEGRFTRNRSVKERPVISEEDLRTMNNEDFGRGEMYTVGTNKRNPIFAGNQTALPYSFALHAWNRLPHEPGHSSDDAYTVKSLPIANAGRGFDRINNTPDFFAMVTKRVRQARLATAMRERYKVIRGMATVGHPLSDDELMHIDADEVACDIMRGINETLRQDALAETNQTNAYDAVATLVLDEAEQRFDEAESNDAEIQKGYQEGIKMSGGVMEKKYLDGRIDWKTLTSAATFRESVREALQALGAQSAWSLGANITLNGTQFKNPDGTVIGNLVKDNLGMETFQETDALMDWLQANPDWETLISGQFVNELEQILIDKGVLSDDDGNGGNETISAA